MEKDKVMKRFAVEFTIIGKFINICFVNKYYIEK